VFLEEKEQCFVLADSGIFCLDRLPRRPSAMRYLPYHTLAEEVITSLPKPASLPNAEQYSPYHTLAEEVSASLPKPASRRRDVELLLFDSKTFSSKKKKKF